MNDFKKATAVSAPIQASSVPIGAVAPHIQTRAPHPMDAINQEGERLKAKLKKLADEFNLAQPRASRIIRPEIGSEYWCRFHGCRGVLEVSGRKGTCNICRRSIDVFSTPDLVPRLRLPEVVAIAEGGAEVERLQKAITQVEKEIEDWKRRRAQAEVDLMNESLGNRPGPPSPWIQTWK